MGKTIFKRKLKIARKTIDRVVARVYNKVAMAKYDTLRKLSRNKKLWEYSESHPELSLNEIGQKFNISASRVWRILHGNKGKKRCET